MTTTAEELLEDARRMYRAAVQRQARTSRRDEEAMRAHRAVLARCDEAERALAAAMKRAEAAESERDELRAQYRCAECQANRRERDELATALAEVRDRMRVVTSRNVPLQAIVDACKAAVAAIPAELASKHIDDAVLAAVRLAVDEALGEPGGAGREARIDRICEEARRRRLSPSPVVCTTCNDTHRMTLSLGEPDERVVMCTFCPVPCKVCRSGAYCRSLPCLCECHHNKTV